MKQRGTDAGGEALAARVNEEIERLDLAAVFAAEYVAERERVRVRRFDDGDAVDYPIGCLWSDRAIDDLRLFAKLRGGEHGSAGSGRLDPEP